MTSSYAFIIPALNEEANIGRTIESIKGVMDTLNYSIIVCDNGSTDNTPTIASNAGARVVVNPDATIAKLRNIGAHLTTQKILVFIDADVTLDENWHTELSHSMEKWADKDLIITGSRCRTLGNSSLLDKHWFSLLDDNNSSYINSGHLIVTRQAFELVGGFNENLKTAEDHDFCIRAQTLNISIVPDRNLKAYHFGYPSRVLDFIARESWHGKEDVKSFGNFFESKTAVSSILLTASKLLGILLVVTGIHVYAGATILILSILFTLIILKIKFKDEKVESLPLTYLFLEMYLLGRTLSIFRNDKRPKSRR